MEVTPNNAVLDRGQIN